MLKWIIITLFFYWLIRLLSGIWRFWRAFARPRPRPEAKVETEGDRTPSGGYTRMTQQEISDADYEEIQ
jgi:hypothetical protein